MFDLVQPNCFEALHASIAEAAHRLRPRYRAEYVEACLRREIRGSNALERRAFQAMTDSRHRIIWVLETLGVENAWKAGHQIASAADTLTVSQLEHLMLNFDYGTAHQSIEAIAHLEKLQIAIQRYVDAKNDAWRARDLCRRLRDFQVGLEDYMAVSEGMSQLKRLGVLAILTGTPCSDGTGEVDVDRAPGK